MILNLLTEYKNIKQECKLFHDINGNIIATLFDTKNKYFRLDIGKNDKLEFTKIKHINSLTKVKKSTDYNKIKNILENSLKKKVIDTIDNPPDNYHEELEEDEEYVHEKTIFTHLPEKKYYETENLLPNDEFDEDNITFKFNSNSSTITLPQFNKTFDYPSLYDIIIKNENIVVFTSEAFPYSSYFVSIPYNDNIFELNIIGSSISKYILKYIKKKLIFEDILPDGLEFDYSSDSN